MDDPASPRTFPLLTPTPDEPDKQLESKPVQSSDSSDDFSNEKETEGHVAAEKSASIHTSDDIEGRQPSDPQHSEAADGGEVEKQQTQQSQTRSVNDVNSIPNGGLRAWLTCLGSFCLFLNCWGILNTFGVYQTYYTTQGLRNSTPSAISWIGSIQAFSLVMISSLAGPLYDAGYFRFLIMSGSFLVVFGHMMLSLSTEYYQVLLSQGICVGIGAGFLFLPSVTILSTYFSTRLATAVGIAASGSSIGGVVYPIALSHLIPIVGFGWATRIIGFIAAATLLVANLVMKMRVVPASKRKIVDWGALREAPYMLFVFGCLLAWAGLYAPFFYGELYSLTYNLASEDLSFYTLAFINAGSVFGRILPNILADRTGSFNIVIPASVFSGVLVFCLIPVRSFAPLIVISVLYGFMSGALVSLPATVYVFLSTHKRGMIGTRMGMGFILTSAGILLGAPACGWILAASSFIWVWVFSGVLLTVGGLIMLAGRIAKTGPTLMVKAYMRDSAADPILLIPNAYRRVKLSRDKVGSRAGPPPLFRCDNRGTDFFRLQLQHVKVKIVLTEPPDHSCTILPTIASTKRVAMPKLYALGDLHIGHKANRDALDALEPKPPGSGLIIAGDIGETVNHLTTTFTKAKKCFEHVFWVPGNHELYTVQRDEDETNRLRGESKYLALVRLAQEHGVKTPEDPWMVWEDDTGAKAIIALCFALYDYSFRPPEVSREQAIAWALEKDVAATDEALLFPDPFPTRDAWCESLCGRWEKKAREYSERYPDVPFVIVNHWPLRQDLVYIPLIPRFSLWCGTKRTEAWHRKGAFGDSYPGAVVVVTGHLHVRRTDYIDGCRFEECSLGYPRQWQAAKEAGKDINTMLREILPGESNPAGRSGTAWRRLG